MMYYQTQAVNRDPQGPRVDVPHHQYYHRGTDASYRPYHAAAAAADDGDDGTPEAAVPFRDIAANDTTAFIL